MDIQALSRAKHPHEFRGLWLGHEALHLAPASDIGARRRARSVSGATNAHGKLCAPGDVTLSPIVLLRRLGNSSHDHS
jgi:hypothetical protein